MAPAPNVVASKAEAPAVSGSGGQIREGASQGVHAALLSMRARMSSAFHAVIRGLSFTGLGNRPALTPAHHVDRDTGIGPVGARICLTRTKPVSGKGRLLC